ncbi:MAG: NAD(P)-dependent dehydrogenase (short-subunit alcohol dehydrogenase family) [Pirellulaceae bacterium]|jgi:NAD(P)-dependent dehydrogenase (short-subunit alcohol dehydrogenase family)
MNSKVVLVTGVSRGLGAAMVKELVERDNIVVGCARSENAILKLRTEYPGQHRFDQVNVASDEEVAAWANDVLQTHGPPDLLLNNAALINANASVWNVPVAEFSQLIDVNIKGVYHVLRSFVPAMIGRGSGVIVNFSSGWGRSAAAEVGPYCATKWAIEGLTRSLAEELPAGLAAVPLNPGIIHTEMLESCFGADASSFPSPAKWASKAVPFLLQLSPADNGSPLTAPS